MFIEKPKSIKLRVEKPINRPDFRYFTTAYRGRGVRHSYNDLLITTSTIYKR